MGVSFLQWPHLEKDRQIGNNYRTKREMLPGGIEFNQDVLLTVGDQLLEVLGDGDLDVVFRVIRDGLWDV